MEKKNIKKYAATGLLTVAILAGSGLEIHDTHIEHNAEICPITHIMNVIPNASYLQFGTYIPTGVALHQMQEMKREYEEKGIEDVIITYGKITEKKHKTETNGIIAKWGVVWNDNTNEFSFENEEVLKIRK